MLSPPRRGNVLVFADGDDRSRPLERWILSIGLKPVLLRGREKFYFQAGDDDTIDAIVTDLDTDHPEAHALFQRLLADDLFPGVPQLHIVRDPALHESLLENRVDLVASVLPWPVEAGGFKARLLLAQLLAFSNPAEAADLAQGAADEPGLVQIRDAIQTVARLAHLNDHPDDLPDEPGQDAYRDALAALARRDFDTAVARLIEVLQQNRYYDDDGARKAGIALFTLLGAGHPVTRKHRRTFDMWLY